MVKFSQKKTGWEVVEEGGQVHVLPINDTRAHILWPECWCKPRQDDEIAQLWTHNSADKREEFERGRQPS